VARIGKRFSTALVTGSSSGFGCALTKELLAEGVTVIGVCRNPDLFEAEGNYIPVVCDLSNQEAVECIINEIFDEYPKIDLVINNAGFGVLSELADCDYSVISKQYQVMLVAPTIIAARATQHFRDQSPKNIGYLVQVSSLAVDLPLPLMPVYNACKAGLSALSESLLLDAVDGRFRVVDLRLGDYNTGFSRHMEGRQEWNGVDLRAVMDAHHEKAPKVDHAVEELFRILNRGGNSVQRVGEFFQAKVAPLGPILLPRRLLRAFIRAYYRN